MKKKILVVIGIGLVVRLILAASTFHTDIQAFYLSGQVIGKGNILSLYDYLGELSKDDLFLKVYPADFFIYPPAVYFLLGPFSYLLTLWVNPTVVGSFLLDVGSVLGNWQVNYILLALKLPYLVFDLLIAFLLFRMFTKKSSKFLAFCLWIFNPINLYATYMMGQFDIIPTFFVVLCLYLVNRRKKEISSRSLLLEAVVLGVGGAFKIYPLLFLVPLALLKSSWIKRVSIISVGFFTYLLTILPFLSSPGFRTSALVAGQTLKSLYPKIDVSGGEAILLYPAFLLFFYLMFIYQKADPKKLWQKFFVILLLFFIFTHYHPQWFLWITPFILIDLVRSKMKHLPLVGLILLSFVGLLTFFDAGLTVGLLSPVLPSLYYSTGVWQLISLSPDEFLFRSILQSVFVGVGLYYLYLYFPKKLVTNSGNKHD
jgi:hypothetical protein